GFHGFVPSAQWLRDIYDQFIEEHRDQFNQHTAMLTAKICAIDHSFKLTKHVAKVNGVQIFTALLTVTNEKGEIRVCNLVATKSHSQFVLALQRMRHSLDLYGHDQPLIFYTDTMNDKNFLEKCFPSLQRDLIPIEKHSHLPPLRIPDTFNVSVKNSSIAIDDAMRTILELLPDDDSSTELVIGLDAEWNVELSDRGYVMGRGQTAILQVAHGSNIYILQIGRMLAGHELPLLLKQVLANPKIRKVGCAVTADLKYLQEASRASVPFDDELSSAQVQYAALDVYASLEIYNVLAQMPLPTPLPQEIKIGASILLFNTDKTRLLARGTISPHATDPTFAGINVTSSRCVITIREILVPAAIIANGTSHKKSLEEHGTPPFDIICLRSHLRQAATTSSSLPMPDFPSNRAQEATPLLFAEPEPGMDPQSSTTGVSEEAESTRIGNMLFETLQSQDVESLWISHIRSRSLKDPFHVFNMFYISAAHGLLRDFAVALRDTIFIPDRADKSRIIAWAQAQNPPKTWDDILARNACWLWCRCKRIIPPAEELYPLVATVFQTYGPLKDAKSGLPLFNTAAWGVAKNILELVRKGYVSDPPGIPLYYQVGVDSKTGLPLYRCMRGTNMTEGGVHTHLRSRLPTSGVSVRHVQCCLLDFILRHNLLVGTYNTTGKRFTGHFSIWVTNELQEMLCLVQHKLDQPRMITNWVNGNLYQQTEEVTGVLPIPDDIRSKSGMGAFIAGLHTKQAHGFLASMQGTRKPVLPVHSNEERDLFRELMSGDTGFNESMLGTNSDHAVQLWNSNADVKALLALAEQLKVYYNGDWKRNTNIKQTMAMTADIRVPLKQTLRNPQRLLQAPPVPQSSQAPLVVPSGFRPIQEPQSHSTHNLPSGAASPTSLSSTTPPPVTAHSPLQQSIFDLARKRAANSIPEAAVKKRQCRTCRKCAQLTCPGSQKVTNCTNRCRDCGQVNCRGRNTKRPNVPC
ncbi:hypothetical protein FPV67DRAFT_1394478, partial [Lyophyllum atratum]